MLLYISLYVHIDMRLDIREVEVILSMQHACHIEYIAFKHFSLIKSNCEVLSIFV